MLTAAHCIELLDLLAGTRQTDVLCGTLNRTDAAGALVEGPSGVWSAFGMLCLVHGRLTSCA